MLYIKLYNTNSFLNIKLEIWNKCISFFCNHIILIDIHMYDLNPMKKYQEAHESYEKNIKVKVYKYP